MSHINMIKFNVDFLSFCCFYIYNMKVKLLSIYSSCAYRLYNVWHKLDVPLAPMAMRSVVPMMPMVPLCSKKCIHVFL